MYIYIYIYIYIYTLLVLLLPSLLAASFKAVGGDVVARCAMMIYVPWAACAAISRTEATGNNSSSVRHSIIITNYLAVIIIIIIVFIVMVIVIIIIWELRQAWTALTRLVSTWLVFLPLILEYKAIAPYVCSKDLLPNYT